MLRATEEAQQDVATKSRRLKNMQGKGEAEAIDKARKALKSAQEALRVRRQQEVVEIQKHRLNSGTRNPTST